MELTYYTRRLAIAAALTLVVTTAAALRAQPPTPPPAAGQGQRGGPPPAGAPAVPAKPLIPVAASSIGMNPDKYYGEVVTLFGTVDQRLGATTFSVDQDKTKSTGKEVLVIAPRLHEPVEPNTYVTVIGEVVRPDPAEIAKKSKPGAPPMPPEVLAQHPGRPVIVATAVINSALTDLAKFLPPPMTPEEAAYDKVMKSVAAANGALRKGVEASNTDLVKAQTTILVKALADTEAFWKSRGKADAVKIAADAKKAAEMIELAAVAGNWNEVKTHNTTLAAACSSCHGVYRERGEDGSFFIKPTTSK
jgi:hypothetical protein